MGFRKKARKPRLFHKNYLSDNTRIAKLVIRKEAELQNMGWGKSKTNIEGRARSGKSDSGVCFGREV